MAKLTDERIKDLQDKKRERHDMLHVLNELQAYRTAAPLEQVQEWAKAFSEDRMEIITHRQKEARDNRRSYSAEDCYFDEEYD